MKENKLIYGVDVLDGLKMLEDESVDCVVTSPPYWGLRDYGTAKWDGGSPECDHKIPSKEFDPKKSGHSLDSSHVLRFNRKSCYKCGAIRIDRQLGLEESPNEFIENMTAVFREVRRVLKKTGTCWVNFGDSYSGNCSRTSKGRAGLGADREGIYTKTGEGLKTKDLVGIPWMFAFALRADGWYLRQDIIWSKPNPMPESVQDRCTKSHEYIFLLTRSGKYFYDAGAIKEPAEYAFDDRGSRTDKRRGTECNSMSGKTGEFRNKRSVWEIATQPYPGAHFATFPKEIPKLCITAGCPMGGVVLDPFSGSGTTGEVATGIGRYYIGIDLNKKYESLARERLGLFV